MRWVEPVTAAFEITAKTGYDIVVAYHDGEIVTAWALIFDGTPISPTGAINNKALEQFTAQEYDPYPGASPKLDSVQIDPENTISFGNNRT